MAGMTETGFEKLTLDEIKTEIEDELRATFGAFINLLPGAIFALLVGIFAERESDIWDALEEIYYSQYPNTAEGVSLDNAVTANGITRLAAAKSTIEAQRLFGDSGTLVAAGRKFSVDGNPIAQFETVEDVTLGDGENSIQTITFSGVPDAGNFTLTYKEETTAPILHSAVAADVEAALNALNGLSGVVVTGSYGAGFAVEFAGDDGLQEQPTMTKVSNLTLTSNPVTITIIETQVGENQASVDLIAVNDGETDAPVGTLTVIDTPVSGLNRVLNVNETVLGRLRETDAELRIRRENTLSIAGNATVEAIRSKLRNISGVINAFVFENDTDVEVDGRPPKSYECVVDGGDEDVIADVIWRSKPAGIQTIGDETVIVIDDSGLPRTIKFSRPNNTPIYISIDLTVDDEVFPDNGAAQAQAAIIAWGAELPIGADVVVYPALVGQLKDIPGILDLRVRIGTSPVSTTPGDPAVDDNVTIGADSVAQFTQVNTDINVL